MVLVDDSGPIRFNLMAVELLQEGESDIQKTGVSERMALEIAAKYGHTELVKTFLDIETEPSAPKQDLSLGLRSRSRWHRFFTTIACYRRQ